MNINIQVDKSLFTSSNNNGGGGQQTPGQKHISGTPMNGNSGHPSMLTGGFGANLHSLQSPINRGLNNQQFDSLNPQGAGPPSFGGLSIAQQRSHNGGQSNNNLVPPAVNGPSNQGKNSSSNLSLTINNNTNGLQLPSLQSQRSGNNLSGLSQNNINNELAIHSREGAEQISVNVTITKMGNNVIQSRVDIAKKPLTDNEFEEFSQNHHKNQQSFDEFGFPLTSKPLMRSIDNLNGPQSSLIIGRRQSNNNDHQLQLQQKQQNMQQQNNSGVLALMDSETTKLKKQQEQEQDNKLMERFNKFDKRSLYIFSNRWKFRQYIIMLIRWKYYDTFMILSIIGNSFCLALTDYSDDENQTEWNQVLDKVDQVFTVVYTCEACLKIIAFGFILHQRSYMRDPWNVLDFVVVIIGLISLIPAVPNLKSLRTMRILRPLRSINAVPSMKRLVKTLLLSLPQMGYLVSFLMFFISIMGILGMQMFTRDLYYRCRTTPQPVNGQWLIDPDQQRLCGGNYECNPGTYCGALIEYQIPLEQDEVWTWDFIQYGYFHFDNIGVAMLSIFRVITLEGWTPVMYNYLDASGFIAGIYFPVAIILGSFFLLNLFLAVIMETFSEMNSKQQANDQAKEEQKLAMLKQDKPRLSHSDVVNMMNVAKKKMEIKKGLGNLGDAASMVMYIKSAKINNESETVGVNNDQDQVAPQEQVENCDVQPVIEADNSKIVTNGLVRQQQSQEQMIEELERVNDGSSPNAKRNIQDNNNESEMSESVDLDAQEEADQTIRGQLNNSNNALKGESQQFDEDQAAGEAPSPFRENSMIDNQSLLMRMQAFLLKVCESSYFTILINLSICTNTLCLSLDQYPANLDFQAQLDVINIFFFSLFFLEMVVKIAGMGPKRYISDHYNIFDALIVTLSIIDVSLSQSMQTGDDQIQGRGAISAFRAIRLLRVFKLAKSWKKLQMLLQTIGKSLKDISSFSVLLFLLMFIYVLLGMEIFAHKSDEILPETKFRGNFNNFFNGFVVVFTVLTGENWDETMFQFARQKGYIAIFFFISLIIIGVMIFLNLFLAILLENFDADEEEEEESNLQSVYIKAQSALQWVKGQWYRLKEHYQQKRGETPGLDNDSGQKLKLNVKQLQQIKIEPLVPGGVASGTINVDDQESIGVPAAFSNDGDSTNLPSGFAPNYPAKQVSNLEVIEEQNEDRSPSRYNGGDTSKHTFSHNLISGTGGVFPHSSHNNTFMRNSHNAHGGLLGADSQQNTTLVDNRYGITSGVGLGLLGDNYSDAISQNGGASKTAGFFPNFVNGQGGSPRSINEYENSSPEFVAKLKRGRTLGESKSKFAESFNNPGNNSKRGGESVIEPSVKSGSPSKLGRSPKPKNVALLINNMTLKPGRKSINLGADGKLKGLLYLEGTSLCFLNEDNAFRQFISDIVKSKYFEMFILCLIAISSVLLALDNPINDPNSTLVEFLQDADIILTIFFACESIFKIITFGFLFNKEQSYLRNGWNVIDFVVVIVSIISLAITSNKLKIVKILRLLRVLRPLRVISRNKGLKIGIQALFMAVPSLFNVIIVSMLFFLICGIIGVNYFKGTFFSCSFGDDSMVPVWFINDLIINKFDCLNYGGAWVNADQSFDNVPDAMSTLFQMSTTEGWIDVMYRGIDAVDIDLQPQLNQNTYWALFFMFFIVLGNFLILNLFVGVVVSTFNKEKEILGKNFLLTDKQKLWLDQKKQCMSISPKIVIDRSSSKLREFFRTLVQSRPYDIFILVCIILNTVVLAINWYSQPVHVDDILDYINYTFAIIFAFEAIFKLIAFGVVPYFREVTNVFDFFIVLSSIVSSIVSIVMDVDFGASTTFIRALRITKILKYTKQNRQVKVIFETLYVTIPALTNIGGLLLLFLYIYSVLGVFLFAEVQLQGSLNIHANFQSFGVAFLTLLRCSTGEAWNSIMMDTMRQRSILFQCSDDDFDYDTYSANGMQTTGCGSMAGIIFFITYFLFVPLIFLNLFIAIILEGFEQTNAKVGNLIQEEDLERFRECWSLYDKNGTGFIKITDFAEFMMKLGEPLGWDESIYRDNQIKQDDFMEELNITTYNCFQDYLFWDVIEALTKVYMVKMALSGKLKGAYQLEGDTDEDVYKTDESRDQDDCETQNSQRDTFNFDPEKKIKVRLELEFEHIDDSRQEVMDVEEMKDKENRIRKSYLQRKDSSYTSAHIKAARKILQGLKRLRQAKIDREQNGTGRYTSMKKNQEINTNTKFKNSHRLNSSDLFDNSLFNNDQMHPNIQLRSNEEQKTQGVGQGNISSVLREFEDYERQFPQDEPQQQRKSIDYNNLPFKPSDIPQIVLRPIADFEPTGAPTQNGGKKSAVPGMIQSNKPLQSARR